MSFEPVVARTEALNVAAAQVGGAPVPVLAVIQAIALSLEWAALRPRKDMGHMMISATRCSLALAPPLQAYLHGAASGSDKPEHIIGGQF